MANITWKMNDSTTSGTASQAVSASHPIVGSSEQYVNASYAAGSNAALLSIAFGNAGVNSGNLQAVYMLSTANLTIKTNNSTSPQDTINLLANVSYPWDSSRNWPSPFNGAVSAMYISCNTAAVLQIKVLQY